MALWPVKRLEIVIQSQVLVSDWIFTGQVVELTAAERIRLAGSFQEPL